MGENMSPSGGRHEAGRFSWLITPRAILAALAFVLCASSFLIFYTQRGEIQEQVRLNLAAIANEKTARLSAWLSERQSDAYAVSQDTYFASSVARWLADGAPHDAVAVEIEARLASLTTAYSYEGVILFDPAGDPKLAVGAQTTILPADRDYALRAARSGHIIFSDLRALDGPGGDIVLDYFVPLIAVQNNTVTPVAALMFRLLPATFIYPVIQDWPTAKISAETLLVRREGDDVVYLADVRDREGSALTLRFPLTRKDLPAAMVARGIEGIVEGIDHRGSPVIAALQIVHGPEWGLVVKVDREEARAPVRRLALTISAMALFVFSAVTWVVNAWWRAVSARRALRDAQHALERQALVEHYDYLSKYANDMIVLYDDDFRILEVNDRLVEAFQLPREKLIGAPRSILSAPGQGKGDAELRQILGSSDRALFETVSRRNDGSTFPVEVSLRRVEIEGKRVYQAIARDITERKAAEDRLRQSETKIARTLAQTIEAIALTVETRDPFTAGHQSQAAALAAAIAGELRLPLERVEGIRLGGMIFDIGKISIPAEILNRPARLREYDLELVKTHARIGYDIVRNIDFPWPIAEMILCHHERLDGSGYPDGLKGDAIPLEARILAVADVVEAMCSHRPYRPALGIDAALEEITRGRGRLYDSAAVDACVRLFREKEFKLAA